MKRNDLINLLISDIEALIPAGKDYHYESDYNSSYGGYRLVKVNRFNGGHSGCFGGNATESSVKFQEFENKLRTIIATAETILIK